MKIETIGNKVRIEGNVKSISHYNDIKSSVDQIIQDRKDVVVELVDSMSLTSSVIGYFTKIVNVNDVTLRLYVQDEGLFSLLDDLGLVQILHVQRI